ncbi:MAG: hypothetical protein ACLR8U_15710 [Oscillospiraceae bacterium]
MIEYLRREEVAPVVDGQIQVPSWRPDLRCMADIAEEVARYYGYNKIETTLMRGATTHGRLFRDAQKLGESAAGAAARSDGLQRDHHLLLRLPVLRLTPSASRRTARCARPSSLINPLGEDHFHHANGHPAQHAGYSRPQLTR